MISKLVAAGAYVTITCVDLPPFHHVKHGSKGPPDDSVTFPPATIMRTYASWLNQAASLALTICLWAVFPLIAKSAGVAMFKEHPHLSDAAATPIAYLEIRDNGPLVAIKTSKGTLTYNQLKIVARIEVLSSIPVDIITNHEIQILRTALDDLQKFSTKYPKSAPLLAQHIGSLKDHIARFDGENVRYRGAWIARTEYAKIEERAKLARETAKQEEIKWQAEREKARAEKVALEIAQLKKGLAEHNGRWLPINEVEKLRRDEANAAKAWAQIMKKSVIGGAYSIVAATNDGLVITVHEGKINQAGINTLIAFLFGAQEGMAAEGDTYRNDLYWCGSHQYNDKYNHKQTVNAYCLNKNDAIARVMATIERDTQRGSMTQDSVMAGESVRSMLPQVLKGAKCAGSGFFVGRKGHIVTNAHVIERQSRTVVLFKGQTYDATVEAVSKAADLALLKIFKQVDGLAFANTEARPGSDVFAVGYPQPNIQGLEAKITKGVISSSKGMDDDATLFQIDAAIQPGSSGGPLCNTSGHLVGVIVSTLNPLTTLTNSGSLPQNVNYALKASEVELFLRKKSVNLEVPERSAPQSAGIDAALEATVLVIVF